MSKFADKTFWIDTADRAIATVAQVAVASGLVGVSGLFDVDWSQLVSVAGLAGVVSVLTSVAIRGGAKTE